MKVGLMIDTHIHLNDEQYREDLEDVIKRTKEAGINKVIVICCDYEGIKRGLELLNNDKEKFIYLMIGFHPVEVSKLKDNYLEYIQSNLNNDRVVGIGEIGLDYHWYPEEKDKQKTVFKEQLELAKKLNIPYSVHSREAYDDCYAIINEIGYYNGVIHSFADNFESAKRFLDKGMYIGISGPVTFKNGDNQKDVIKKMNLNKLLLETDGPYLAPVPYRGKRNESIYLEEVLKVIADIKGISQEEIKNQTTKNAKILFKELND